MYATGRADDYQPGPALAVGAQSPVRVLPNFDVVALDGLAPAAALLLDAFATRSADHVWTLSTVSLLKALHAGRGLEELRRFLTGSSPGEELPQTVTALLADAASRTEKVRDLGTCHLLECVDEVQAVVIAKDRRAGALCFRVGPRHLMVAPDDLPAFRTALLKLGCVLPARP
ncbi:helicase-associated domain-containing protein [Streptomyces sp. NPDC057565]|uniref:helicase-associated domain-containing protein n=1 Tax=Streptomyces sp. NPDC057565 TaxID=3346169 RepID=UPI0036936105